jgi:hypothetical protein
MVLILFTLWFVDEHLGCFHLLTLENNATNLVQVFVCVFSFFQGVQLGKVCA